VDPKATEKQVKQGWDKFVKRVGLFGFSATPYGLAGIPDWIGIDSGLMFTIEFKGHNGRVRRIQQIALSRFEKCGAYVRVVSPLNFDQVTKEIEDVLRQLRK
jgi:hypothetical protein